MAVRLPAALGKLAYGALFVALLPPSRALGAGDGRRGPLPASAAPSLGGALLLAGILLWERPFALAARGGGLPMNAFPPPRLVCGGVYAVLAHPIYIGFGVRSPASRSRPGPRAGSGW